MMSDWILKLTGSTVEAGSTIVGYEIGAAGGVGVWVVLLLAAILAMVVVVSYSWMPEEQTSARKGMLVLLRLTFLALLLGILLQPILVLHLERQIRQTLLIMVDMSRSMAIADPRVNHEDVKRAAIAKGKIKPDAGLRGNLKKNIELEVSDLNRTDVLQSVLLNEELRLLPNLSDKFDLIGFTFGLGQVNQYSIVSKLDKKQTNKLAKLEIKDFKEWVQGLEATNSATALGDSLREVLKLKRGQPIAGILVASDGGQNAGSQPGALIKQLNDTQVPLYFYGVGITSPRDIIVSEMDSPEAAFLEDELLVKVRIRSQGLTGENEQLILTLDGQEVSRETVFFGKDGEQNIPLRFKPDEVGDFELKAYISVRGDETAGNNNEIKRRLRITDEKIRVLFVEQSPRWDFKYLYQVLTRDKRMDAKILLFEGDPALAREEGSPYIEQFPENKKELFEYDVVVFGDVDPKNLSITQMENLNEFVSRFGGAFVMIAGRQNSPFSFADTPISDMLPIEFEGEAGGDVNTVYDKPIQVELTSLGMIDPMFDLSDEETSNESLWNELPPIYWVAAVERKPGAEILMVDPAVKSERGKRPVIARHQYGLGQVLYVGTDNTWRWRRNVEDLYYTRFWRQVNQRMAQKRLIGADKRTQISLNSQNYMSGDRVRAYARLYQVGYEPLNQKQVSGVHTNEDGKSSQVLMKAVVGRPGLYFGEFYAPPAGQYQFHVASEPKIKRNFTVVETTLEMSETAMNEGLMKNLADQTGGEYFREENLHELPSAINTRKVVVPSRLEVELWATPLYFLLIMIVVTFEWILRKFSFLK